MEMRLNPITKEAAPKHCRLKSHFWGSEMPLRNIFVTTVIETRRPMFKIVCGTIKMTDHSTNDQAQIKKPKNLRHFC